MCLICFDYHLHNINRQPWRYIYEIASYLVKNGVNLTIITNREYSQTSNTLIDNQNIRCVRRIYSCFSFTQDVLDLINEEKPEVIVSVIDVFSFIRGDIDHQIPMVGILTTPLYTLNDVLHVGIRELLRHNNYLLNHLLGSVIPKIMIKYGANKYARIVVLSKRNEKKLKKYGISQEKLALIPPGIDDAVISSLQFTDYNPFQNKKNFEQKPSILYFGSPLTLRGTDLLIKSFFNVNKKVPSRLIILSRPDTPDLKKDHELLQKLIIKKGLSDSVTFISQMITKEDLHKYLTAASIVCLPFKIVISDFPISILESMALGKPIVSVDLDGITECLENRGYIVKPCDETTLSKTLIKALENPALSIYFGHQAQKYLQKQINWSDAGKAYVKIIETLLA